MNKINKCSSKEHQEINAVNYCLECKVHMCNKCSNYHRNLFENHHQYIVDIDINDEFLDICKEENHLNKLEYFCKDHNTLCCVACIAKIRGKGNGQHKDCEILLMEDIKEEKKNKLKENIKFLEDLSNDFEQSVNELKILFEKINKNKETLKDEVLTIFRKIRKAINEREDELLKEIDSKFIDLFCNEDTIKENEKFPIKIKISLEKGKIIEKKWNENEIKSLINDCINIENNIKRIKLINDDIKKCNLNKNLEIRFLPKEKDADSLIYSIKNFGFIYYLDSLIITKHEDFNKFHKLISANETIHSIRLIYRSTVDGFNYLSIVNKINNKSNLIFLYLTGNKRIFGAFIKTKLENINLNGSRKYFKDTNAFSFSLDNNKNYKILIPENAIGFDSTYYILIGNNGNGNGFYYYHNCLFDKQLINGCKIYEFSKNSELTEGFDKITELEIFEINSY